MTAKEFVELFYKEKNDLLKIYFEDLNNTEFGIQIKSLNLTEEQMRKMESIINNVIVDTMYTTLLGLDGCASIGDMQQEYKIYDENGCELTGCGEIEEYAYEYFQENK
ncbi:hypothetical protein K0039_07660 [Terrisporobacter mayombei]|nr:hypothetical protein [Terrisporobacter mayombei]